MATTTNYGWTTPDDTALVKDGASAIRSLGTSVDTTTKNLNPSTTLGDIEYRSSTANVNTRLPLGTAGQVLKVNSGATAPEWATDATGMTNPMTTTGDTIYSSSGSTPARLGIGSTGNVLTVAGGVPTWAAPAAGGMTLIATTTLSGATTTVTISANTYNYLVMVTEKINCSNDATPQIYANGTASITDYVRLNGYGTSGQDLLSTADTNLGLSWAGASDFESGNTDNAAVVTLYNINSTGHKPINVTSGFMDNSSLRKSSTNGGGQMKLAAVVTSITYTVTAGTFNGGTLYTYGVK
jgi:hypothetical protein